MLEKVGPLFDMPFVKVTRSLISKLKDKLLERHSHRASGYVLSILSVAFEHGIERELVTSHPVQGVARPRRPRREPEDIVDEAATPRQVEDEEKSRPWKDEEWTFPLSYAPLQLQVTILLVTIGVPWRLAIALEALHGRFAFAVTRLAVKPLSQAPGRTRS
jgi:hypothetical protein